MIREKTRGNPDLTETEILSSVLSDLQMAFVQASLAAKVFPSDGNAFLNGGIRKRNLRKRNLRKRNLRKKSQEEAAAASTERRTKFSKSYGS